MLLPVLSLKAMRAVGLRRHLPIHDAEALLDLELPPPQLRPQDLLLRIRDFFFGPGS